MNQSERERWTAYLRELADRMGLKDWEVEIDEKPVDDGPAASVWMRYGQRQARVRVGREFEDADPYKQRHLLVHELVHLHFAMMDGLAEDWLSRGRYHGFLRAFEYGVDATARSWAAHLPLPLATTTER